MSLTNEREQFECGSFRAHALYSGKFCPLACETVANYATFNDTDPSLSRKVNACLSDLRITSLYLCFDGYCENDGEVAKWIAGQNPWCYNHANVTLPSLQDVVSQWPPESKAKVERISATEALTFPHLDHLVIPESTFFDRVFTTMHIAFWEYDIHLVYGWCMYYFWIAVIAVGVTTRLCALIGKLQYRNRDYQSLPEVEPNTPLKSSGAFALPRAWLKRHITTPAAFGDRCSRPWGWCTIPARVQSLTILLFVSLNIVLCSCSYRLTEGNIYWPEKSAQLLRYVSDRTGIISLANFPLVWLFGMRNDVLIWITGWGFGTYNAFHRWVARVATVQAVIHSVGYTVMILESGGWPSFLKHWTKHYFWNGEVATIAMCGLLAFSVYGIRRSHYEVFLFTHILLSIAALWSMYYHVEIFTAGEWNIFIWPCLAVWVADRLLRLARIVAFSRSPLNVPARASFDSNSNLVRLDVDGSKSVIAPKPGTYYYIHVLDDLLHAYQSHPFTLAYVAPDVDIRGSTPLSPLASRPAPWRSSSASSSESDLLLANTTSKACTNLVFLVRPYNGFTSRLRSSCLLHPKKLRVLIDGPYGHTLPLRTFTNVLFVVGGTGIAVPLSHLADLLSASSYVQNVKVVWAVREHAFLASVLRDFEGALGDERVEMEVHITRDEQVMNDVLGRDLKSVSLMAHRPDVHRVVEEAAENAKHQRLAVVACGPSLMADQARKASVDMLGTGHTGVEYFEESFKW
ncbi:ferric-chelate reductase [Stemphylium lycopersici]|nr:ferric-chelate reductase [Stemphylium lycopersici]